MRALCSICRERYTDKHQRKNCDRSSDHTAFSRIAGSFYKKDNTEQNKCADAKYGHSSLLCCKIIGIFHGKQIWNAFQIRVSERRNAVGKHTAVDDSENRPESADDHADKRTSAEQIYQCK